MVLEKERMNFQTIVNQLRICKIRWPNKTEPNLRVTNKCEIWWDESYPTGEK